MTSTGTGLNRWQCSTAALCMDLLRSMSETTLDTSWVTLWSSKSRKPTTRPQVAVQDRRSQKPSRSLQVLLWGPPLECRLEAV